MAYGDFFYKGRSIHDAEICLPAAPADYSATNIDYSGRKIVGVIGHAIMEEMLAEDVWSFLEAAPLCPLLRLDEDSRLVADRYDF